MKMVYVSLRIVLLILQEEEGFAASSTFLRIGGNSDNEDTPLVTEWESTTIHTPDVNFD